ncbi:MAG: YihY/virulence factor BrkB family protein [Chitinophagales bacterium]|nr:YihY/virulence factor BrkB family protein [Chitinophagales bacterium]
MAISADAEHKVGVTQIPGLFSRSFNVLQKNHPLQMAGSTAFFTTFALPSILIIIIQVFGLFINQRFLSSQLINRMTEVLGKEEGQQLTIILLNFRKMADNRIVTIGGFIFLLFIASTLFNEIKNSINKIWHIRIKQKPGLLFRISIRGRLLGVICLAGLLFLFGLLAEGLAIFFGKSLGFMLPGTSTIIQSMLREIISILMVSAWFLLLLRFIADGRPSWFSAITSGTLTGLLFTAGKLVLIWFLPRSNIGTVYGASGSVVLLLLFVFYSSFILYFGACFTKVLSEALGHEIIPVDKAYRYKIVEIPE